MRQKRKLDHINLVQHLEDEPETNGFEDIQFVHNCLPEIDAKDINLSAEFLGRQFHMPIMINSITGGVSVSEKINAALARVSRKLGIPMAVGSQTAALDDKNLCYTFEIARQENPYGFIAANIGAGVPVARALEAVEMISADALQLHLNIPQELMMSEKEREPSCRGYLDNIQHLVEKVPIPVIIKEVGCGIAREQALQFLSTGADALDVGGRGGTNFIRVEGLRHSCKDAEPFLSWGLPTAVTLSEVIDAIHSQIEVVAAGGIRNGLDAAKAVSMGAALVAVAGPLLRCFYEGGELALEKYILRIHSQFKKAMFMLGAKNISELREKPVIVMGQTGEWLQKRGINLNDNAPHSNRGFRKEF